MRKNWLCVVCDVFNQIFPKSNQNVLYTNFPMFRYLIFLVVRYIEFVNLSGLVWSVNNIWINLAMEKKSRR